MGKLNYILYLILVWRSKDFNTILFALAKVSQITRSFFVSNQKRPYILGDQNRHIDFDNVLFWRRVTPSLSRWSDWFDLSASRNSVLENVGNFYVPSKLPLYCSRNCLFIAAFFLQIVANVICWLVEVSKMDFAFYCCNTV